jgi:osmoprotectant transport system permease protein
VVAGEGDVMSQFGDAIDFIFTKQVGRGGAEVGGSQLLDLIAKHLELTGAAMALAIAVALPIGVWLGHTGRGSFLALSVSNVGRAVPSIAIVFVFFAYLGAGFTNIMLALALLAIPPILTNAYVGVREVDPGAVDAARGMGHTGFQIVRRVELPLALPLVFGGIRTSTVNVLATATIAPFAGVVTLGDPIINPSTYGDAGRLGASIVVAVMAIAADFGVGLVQRAVTPAGLKLSTQAARRRGPFWFPKRRMHTTP